MRRFALVLIVLAALVGAPSAFADAVVTNGDDSGPGSFRDALAAGGTITFAPDVHGTVPFSNPLTVSKPVDIIGPPGYFFIRHPLAWGGGPPLLDFASGSSGSTVTGLEFLNTPDDAGIRVENGVTGIKITNAPMCNVTPPIDLLGAGTAVPTDLKVGPRRADGTLSLTGVASAPGSVDVYDGELHVQFLGMCRVRHLGSATVSEAGPFTVAPFAIDPDGLVHVTLTGSAGTSEWSADVPVPHDITSPTILSARAVNNHEVVVTPSETLDPSSVALGDFSLIVAGTPRPLTGHGNLGDVQPIHLTSSHPWKPGQVGSVAFSRPGAVSDFTGNVNSSTARVTFTASPGDFQAPVVTKLRLKASHRGTTITFTTSEPGRAVFQIYSSSHRRVGSFVKLLKRAGVQRIEWRGHLHHRTLRPGGYVMQITMTDSVGNITDAALHRTFRVLRTTR